MYTWQHSKPTFQTNIPTFLQTEEEMYGYTGANFTQELGDDVPEYMAPLTAGPASGSRDWRTATVVNTRLSPKSRVRDDVGPAGCSLLWELWRELTRTKAASSSLFPSRRVWNVL